MQRVINFSKYGSNFLIVSVILTFIGLIYTFFIMVDTIGE